MIKIESEQTENKGPTLLQRVESLEQYTSSILTALNEIKSMMVEHKHDESGVAMIKLGHITQG